MLHLFRTITTAVIAVSFSLLTAANASSATTFTGRSSGSFGPPEIDREQDPNATFTVDSPTPGSASFTLGQPGDSSQPNRLTFTQANFAATEDNPFAIGNLAFFNGQTFDGTLVSGVPLNVELTLEAIPQSLYQFQYQLNFDFTLNNTADYDTDADVVTITDKTQSQTFNFEQSTYELTLLGFSQDGGQTFARSLQVFEDQTIDSTLLAQIKLAAISPDQPPADIPEPALISTYLFLASLLLIERRA